MSLTLLRHWALLLSVPSLLTYEMDMLIRRLYFCHPKLCNCFRFKVPISFVHRFPLILSILFKSLPISANTFAGWTCLFCIHQLFGYVYVLVNIPIVTFVMANGYFFEASAIYFQTFFDNINSILVHNPSPEMKLNAKRSLIKAVNFHNTTKR